MRINRLTLKNFRLFENYNIKFHKNLTVLVANNSAGKTSILDSVSVILGSYTGVFPIGQSVGFKSQDATILENGEEPKYPISASADLNLKENTIIGFRELKSKKGKTTSKDISSLTDYAKENYQKIKDKNIVDLPVVAYYGTSRLWKDIHHRKEAEKDSYARSYGYYDCLNPNSNYKELEKWFKRKSREEDSEIVRRVKAKEDNVNYKDSALENIKSSINVALEHLGFKNIHLNGEDIYIQNQDELKLEVSTLSDGVKSMISLIGDIAYRTVQLNPHFGEKASEKTEGIILIDEVDMHLHPSWQQVVLQDLQKIFPKIQFIVTTHSPQVLTSVRKENIRILDLEQNNKEAKEPPFESYGRESQITLEDIMNVPATPYIKETEELKNYLRKVQDGEIDGLDEIREKLNEAYGENYEKLLIADMIINKHKALREKK